MRPKNLRFFVWGTVLFFVFLFLLFLETKRVFVGFDLQITNWLQTIIPRTFDMPFSFFTLAGNIEPTTILLVLIGIFIFRKEKKIYYPLVLFAVVGLFEIMGKYLLYHPGPPAQFFRFILPFDYPHLYLKSSYSFPSGHVSRTLFLVVILIFLSTMHIKNVGKKFLLTASCYLLAALMVISRIYLGEHWTSDVIGGIFLGASMGLLSLVYY